jgi:hypothetical protein
VRSPSTPRRSDRCRPFAVSVRRLQKSPRVSGYPGAISPCGRFRRTRSTSRRTPSPVVERVSCRRPVRQRRGHVRWCGVTVPSGRTPSASRPRLSAQRPTRPGSRQAHERLHADVLAAYGWPADLDRKDTCWPGFSSSTWPELRAQRHGIDGRPDGPDAFSKLVPGVGRGVARPYSASPEASSQPIHFGSFSSHRRAHC